MLWFKRVDFDHLEFLAALRRLEPATHEFVQAHGHHEMMLLEPKQKGWHDKVSDLVGEQSYQEPDVTWQTLVNHFQFHIAHDLRGLVYSWEAGLAEEADEVLGLAVSKLMADAQHFALDHARRRLKLGVGQPR